MYSTNSVVSTDFDSLQGYGLVDISLLSSYPHLQRVVLASNDLTGIDIIHVLASCTQVCVHVHVYSIYMYLALCPVYTIGV